MFVICVPPYFSNRHGRRVAGRSDHGPVRRPKNKPPFSVPTFKLMTGGTSSPIRLASDRPRHADPRVSETSRSLFPHSGFVDLQVAEGCLQYWNSDPMPIGPAHEIANCMLALRATTCIEVIEDRRPMGRVEPGVMSTHAFGHLVWRRVSLGVSNA